MLNCSKSSRQAPTGQGESRALRRRRLALNLTLLCGSLLSCLLFFEILSRLYYGLATENLRMIEQPRSAGEDEVIALVDLIRLSKNKRIVYELDPGTKGVYFGAPARISAQGLRDREFALTRPEGVFRIVGIGDSISFGQGVGAEACYLKVLERFLNQFAGTNRYEVLNFGVPGYNTVMEAETLRARAFAFAPQVVLWQSCVNDAGAPDFVTARPDVWSLRQSFLFRLTHDALRPRGRSGIDQDGRQGLRFLMPDERTGENEELAFLFGAENRGRASERIVADARQKGIACVALPAMFDYDSLQKTGTSRDDKDFLWLFDFADAEGVPIADPAVDVVPFLKRHGLPLGEGDCAASRFLWVNAENDAHPNEAQHILIAKSIFRVLVAENLTPDATRWTEDIDRLLGEFDREADALFAKGRSSGLKP